MFLSHSLPDKSFSVLRDRFETIWVALASFTLSFLSLFKILFFPLVQPLKDQLLRRKHALEVVASVWHGPTLVLPTMSAPIPRGLILLWIYWMTATSHHRSAPHGPRSRCHHLSITILFISFTFSLHFTVCKALDRAIISFYSLNSSLSYGRQTLWPSFYRQRN